MNNRCTLFPLSGFFHGVFLIKVLMRHNCSWVGTIPQWNLMYIQFIIIIIMCNSLFITLYRSLITPQHSLYKTTTLSSIHAKVPKGSPSIKTQSFEARHPYQISYMRPSPTTWSLVLQSKANTLSPLQKAKFPESKLSPSKQGKCTKSLVPCQVPWVKT